MDNRHPYMTTKEAAAFLRYEASTLAVWRSQGIGPKYIKIKAAVRYGRNDLEQWMQASPSQRQVLEKMSECHTVQKNKAKRPRGRMGAAQRARRLEAEPNCRDCFEFGGIIRKAVEVDHIIPISRGGSDDDDNVRCLCASCHQNRTHELRKGNY